MVYEVTSVSQGKTSVWTVQAIGPRQATREAYRQFKNHSYGPGSYIVDVKPQGGPKPRAHRNRDRSQASPDER